MLKKLSITIAVIIFLVSLSLCFKSIGLDEGWQLASKNYMDQIGGEMINVSAHGPRIYEFLAEKYGLICWILIIFGIGKLFELIPAYKHREGCNGSG
jgi:hypothetical protein